MLSTVRPYFANKPRSLAICTSPDCKLIEPKPMRIFSWALTRVTTTITNIARMSELILFIALYYHTPNFAGNGIHLHRMSKLTREDGKFRQAHRHKKKYVSPLRLGVFA